MKLKSLDIHNIASIADARIDFDGGLLRDEALFLICGETGSGKTTILDAICLVLYNKTPRLSQASARESYVDSNGETLTLSNPVQYLRKGAWEAALSLTFEAQGKDWEARWSTRRANRKADGKFQGIVWEVTDISSGITSKGSTIENIVGLSFDEFRRTTMLAQGEFTAFLKSRDDEKSAILEKITGTGIYREIGRGIGERYRQSNVEHMGLQEALKGLREGLLDDDRILLLETEMKESRSEVLKLEEERKTLDAADKAFREIELNRAEMARQQASLDASVRECLRLKGGIAYAEASLRQEEEYAASLDRFIKENAAHAGMYAESALLAARLRGITADQETMRQAEAEIKGYHESTEVIDSEIRDIAGQMELRQKECLEKETVIAGIREELAQTDAVQLRRRKAAAETMTRLSSELSAREKACRDVSLELERQLALSEGLQRDSDTACGILESTSALYARMKESNEQWAKDARASLTVGASCPVCGQVIATQEYLDSISDGHFESVLRPVAEQLELHRKQASDAAEALSANLNQVKMLREISNIRTQELASVQAAMQTAVDEYGTATFSEDEYMRICRALEKADRLTETLDKANKELAVMNRTMAMVREKHSDALLRLERTKGQLNTARQKLAEASQRVEAAFVSVRERMTSDGWESEWNSGREEFCVRLQAKASEYERAVRDHAAREARIVKIREGLYSIRLIYADVEELMPSVKEVRDVEPVKVERLENRLAVLKAEVMTAMSVLNAAKEKIEAYSAAVGGMERGAVAERLEQTGLRISGLNQRIGACARTLEANQEALKKIGDSMEALEKAAVERDQWKALNDVFGRKDGEYFQKIAQGFIMNDILSRANHYLKDMTRRYRLESQQGSLNIVVRDMEQGGVPRSTSTISGGESFVISLALALGLSTLGGGDVSADILFIDEGFGSLSGDYLDTVVETLQKLHEKSGRKVGVISHIAQLRNRIAVKISVSKINQTVSRVEIVNG